MLVNCSMKCELLFFIANRLHENGKDQTTESARLLVFLLVWVEQLRVRRWQMKVRMLIVLMHWKASFCLSRHLTQLTVTPFKVWRVCSIMETRATLMLWYRHCLTGMCWVPGCFHRFSTLCCVPATKIGGYLAKPLSICLSSVFLSPCIWHKK